MLGGQTGTSLLTCLSLAHSSLFLSHTFFCPQSHSLNYTHTHTHMHMNTLVTIKQVVLSSWLSPCLFLCAIYELSQLFLTVEPQLTPQTCTTCTLAHTHTHRVLHSVSRSFSLLPFHHQLNRMQPNPSSRRVVPSVCQHVSVTK